MGFHGNVMSYILKVCDIPDRWQHGMGARSMERTDRRTDRVGRWRTETQLRG